MRVLKNPDGTWRVTDVPIVSTGIEYPLGTGLTTFTDVQLKDAVSAATTDPAVVAPRIKLGHTSEYNDILVGEAEQAFGRIDVETMRMGDNGQTIFADYTGMPEWLASVLPMAYPNRSIEGNFDVETVTGKQHGMVIKAVSLLGVRWPGCQVLPDLPLWYGSTVPEGAEIDAIVTAPGGGMADRIEALVDVDRAKRKFYAEYAVADKTRWWIRGIKFDSNAGLQLICDDESNGNLYRVPVEVDEEKIVFGDPIQVTEEFPDKSLAASAVMAGMSMFDEDMIVYASRAESRPDNSNQEGATMDEATRLALATHLGLSEDSSEEQIMLEVAKKNTALAAVQAGRGEPGAESAGTTESEEGEPATGEEGEQPAPVSNPDDENGEGAEASAPEIIHLDKQAYEELRAGASLATRHEQERQTSRIAATVAEAVSVGKIPPARKKSWETALAADFDGNKALLDSLEAGLVPVHMRGTAGNAGDGESTDTGEGLPDNWFPEIAASRASKGRDRRVLQAREG
jgi:hypothetical protein